MIDVFLVKRSNRDNDPSEANLTSHDEVVNDSPAQKQARIKNMASATQRRRRSRAAAPSARQRSARLLDKLAIPSQYTEHGMVYVFGSGDTGQLGLGDNVLTRKKPMPLSALANEPICNVVCGGLHTVALTTEGKLWSWGCNDERALGRSGEEYEPGRVEGLDNVRIVRVACGGSITLALSDEGKLYCWGTFRSSEGALGFSRNQAVRDTPRLFEPLAHETIVDIAAGANHCLALTASGRVYSWGDGGQYQLGRRIIERRKQNGLFPERLWLKNIKAIGTGAYHSFAISRDNKLYVWGLNNFNQCGMGNSIGDIWSTQHVFTEPVVVPTLEGKGAIRSVTAGEHHSFVLMESGEVYAFGRADSSQLGLPQDIIDQLDPPETLEAQNRSRFKRAIGTPTQIPGLNHVKQIDSGSNHAIALTEDGLAYTWGFGEMSALGTGDDSDAVEPTLLTGQKLDGHKVICVSAGGQHTALVAQ